MREEEEKLLAEAARKARGNAWAPYSGFTVGAALLCADGTVCTGCNVESTSYSPSCCAERVAFYKAVSVGERKFAAIAIAGGKAGEEPSGFCPPCGVCRQVMAEFCAGDFPVILAGRGTERKTVTLAELLPLRFGPDNLLRE